MPFSLFLALRYLKPKRSVISMITLFCVMGVMLGVGALVVVMSVINGIQNKVREELLKFEPHIVAMEHPLPPGMPEEARPSWRKVAEALRAVPGAVTAVTPVVDVSGLVEMLRIDGTKTLRPIQMSAVDPRTAGLEGKLRMIDGSADLEGDNAVISESLAVDLGVGVGDTITVQSFRNGEEMLRMIDEWEKTPKEERGEAEEWFEKMKQVVQPSDLTVTGVFRTPQRFVPVFIPLHVGQEMKVMGGQIDFLGVTTPDALEVGKFRTAVQEALPYQHWTFETWRERNRSYFDAVETERGMLYVLLLLIMIVAAFCIIVTLATVAIHKRKEIGVVRSLGAGLSQILAIFVQQGMIVGFLGTLLGVLGGLVFLHFRMQVKALVSVLFGVEILDPAVYGVSEIPSDVQADDLMIIGGIAMIVSTLAGIVPALMAAGQDPAKALRSE